MKAAQQKPLDLVAMTRNLRKQTLRYLRIDGDFDTLSPAEQIRIDAVGALRLEISDIRERQLAGSKDADIGRLVEASRELQSLLVVHTDEARVDGAELREKLAKLLGFSEEPEKAKAEPPSIIADDDPPLDDWPNGSSPLDEPSKPDSPDNLSPWRNGTDATPLRGHQANETAEEFKAAELAYLGSRRPLKPPPSEGFRIGYSPNQSYGRSTMPYRYDRWSDWRT
jgi:hypothetical protein